jgi:hypothetical protein
MLPHFVVAVSTVVIALAALLKTPWHCSVRITEPIANIDVGAMTARNRPSAAAVLQWVIPAPAAIITSTIGIHFLRGQVAVWIAHPVTSAEIPAVSAGRRTDGYAVLDLLDHGLAIAQRVTRYSQLKRERHAGYV